jgi:hypothetical protein
MLRRVWVLSLAPLVIGLSASVAGAVTAGLTLAPGQPAVVKSGGVVWLAVNLANNTKAADLVEVKLSITVVCPFRPAPVIAGFTLMLPLKPGQAFTQRIPIPVPRMVLLKPLAWTVTANCKGIVSKTQASSSVSFTVTP